MSPDRHRFLILTPALDGRDGISEVSRQVVRAIVDRTGPGRVETWAYRGTAPSALDDVPVHAFRSADDQRSRLVAWSARYATRTLEDLTVIVMHLHLAPLAGILATRGARTAVFLHGIEAWEPLRLRDRLAVARASRIIANSRRTADRFRAANPSLGSVVVCPLGVRHATPVVRWPGEPGFALIVGRLAASERYKGHDALIDAWPIVLESMPGARLVVAGDGDDRPRLEAIIAARGLARGIRFVGRVSDGELRGLYQACGAFVMPSAGEGFGLVYLEAMRAGKPCVALRAAEEIIEDGRTGILLDSTEPRVLAGALIQLLKNPALRHRLGNAGAERVNAYFDERHFARRFTDAIGLAAPSRRANPAHTISAGA